MAEGFCRNGAHLPRIFREQRLHLCFRAFGRGIPGLDRPQKVIDGLGQILLERAIKFLLTGGSGAPC